METRANYVLIGACALVGIVLGLAFFVWLAKFQVDRQYAYYDIMFDDVSGLSRASDVRFGGLSVGQVMSLDLDVTGGGLVRVRVEVDADTPVHEGATAQLQPQGVTGVSLVSLTGGDLTKPLLRDATKGGVPVIRGQRSVVQSIAEDAPALIAQARVLIEDLQAIVSPANLDKVASILANVDTASGELGTAIAGVSSIAGSVKTATGEIAGFTDHLGPLAEQAGTTMQSLTGTLDTAKTTLKTADGALAAIGSVAKVADGILSKDGTAAVADLRATTDRLKLLMEQVGSEAHAVLTAYGDTATSATSRLDELKATIASLDTTLAGATKTLASIDAAASGVDGLVRGDGTALVGDARTTLASVQASAKSIETITTTDLPAVVSEVRQGIAAINTAVAQVSGDVTGMTSSLAPLVTRAGTTLDTATGAFRSANTALDRLEPVLTEATGTLQAARSAFGSADRIIAEDVSPAAADLRTSAARLSDALEAMSADLPAVTGELRAAVAQANATVQRIDAAVQANTGPIGQFTAQGLPQFVRFAQEAQALVARLDRLAAQFERDPARFILSPPAPTYRR